MEDLNIESAILRFVKFCFYRYAAGNMPSDTQLMNALNDFRIKERTR